VIKSTGSYLHLRILVFIPFLNTPQNLQQRVAVARWMAKFTTWFGYQWLRAFLAKVVIA
jgi:hypothetical protein